MRAWKSSVVWPKKSEQGQPSNRERSPVKHLLISTPYILWCLDVARAEVPGASDKIDSQPKNGSAWDVKRTERRYDRQVSPIYDQLSPGCGSLFQPGAI